MTRKAVYGNRQGGSHYVKASDPTTTLCGMEAGDKASKSWINCSGCYVHAKRALAAVSTE